MLQQWRWSIAMVGAAALAALAGGSCAAGTEAGSDGGGSGGAGTEAQTGTMSTFAGGDTASSSTGMMSMGCDPTTCGAANGSCIDKVCTIVENPGNVDGATQGTLDAGGNADPSLGWLYPYDATVFPRGLISPTLQLSGASPQAIKVRVTSPGMNYTGYFGGSSPIKVKLADPTWTAITVAAGPLDDVHVEVTTVAGGQASGPVSENWTIAQGNIRGSIYYETYDSQLAGGLGSVGLMKISPGALQPTVIKSGCGNVCHTASADGSRLVASTAFPAGSASYDLSNTTTPLVSLPDNSFTYGGIYPDGSFVVSATNYRTWVPGFGGGPSRVYDVPSGLMIGTPSWDSVVTNAAMPAFSPDGKWITFNHFDTGQGHSIATMQYDNATKTFSNLVDVTSNPGSYLGWPAFTPDSKWIVYHAGSSNVFETDAEATGDLVIVDASTHQTARLDLLDGYKNGQSYLPANDPNLNFVPTVLPVAVGGYFWVVFTSHRSYGNTLPSKDNNDQNGKLWVAAIDLHPTDGADPSHPAFYLDGQEAPADNLRGFWVLDPCKADGETCISGDQCCGGYCENGVCTTNHSGCSNTFDKCMTSADCCNPSDECINGHCATPPPS